MLDTLDTAIEEARRKVESGRVYDAENEKVRIKWIRTLAYTVNVRRQVTADRDLKELTERVAELERRQGRDP
jgi:chromosome segregation ATPase